MTWTWPDMAGTVHDRVRPRPALGGGEQPARATPSEDHREAEQGERASVRLPPTLLETSHILSLERSKRNAAAARPEPVMPSFSV